MSAKHREFLDDPLTRKAIEALERMGFEIEASTPEGAFANIMLALDGLALSADQNLMTLPLDLPSVH